MTIAPAAIDPVGSSNCELPVKLAIATGAVIARWVAVNDSASNRSFHAKMNKAEIAQKVEEAAKVLDLSQLLDRKPAQLSLSLIHI